MTTDESVVVKRKVFFTSDSAPNGTAQRVAAFTPNPAPYGTMPCRTAPFQAAPDPM